MKDSEYYMHLNLRSAEPKSHFFFELHVTLDSGQHQSAPSGHLSVSQRHCHYLPHEALMLCGSEDRSESSGLKEGMPLQDAKGRQEDTMLLGRLRDGQRPRIGSHRTMSELIVQEAVGREVFMTHYCSVKYLRAQSVYSS